jgi:hypothetical protein
MKDHKVKFMPPTDFKLPEDVQDGGEFDAVCTFKVENGELCLTQLGDSKMAGYGEKEGAKHKPGYGEYAAQMQKAGNEMT